MAEIGQQVFAVDGTRNFLRLYKEEFVRPFNPPSISTRMRVSVLLQVADTGGNFVAPDSSFIGFCQGTSQPYKDASPLRVMGVRWRNAQTWTYTGGATPYYSGIQTDGIRILSGVSTTSSMTNSTLGAFATTGGTPRRSLVMVEINNPQTETKIEVAAQVPSDFTFFNFLEAAEAANNQPAYNYGATLLSSYVANVGASPTALDAVNIYWGNGGIAPLIIYAIAVYNFIH